MLLHALHKQFAPDTYPCSLCALTYGPVSMRGEWKQFLDELPMDVVFHHRDDFAADYPGESPDLPAILVAEPGRRLRTIVGAQQLDAMECLSDLIVEVESQVEIERVNMSFVRVSA